MEEVEVLQKLQFLLQSLTSVNRQVEIAQMTVVLTNGSKYQLSEDRELVCIRSFE